jgi:hypothetical protein
MVEQIGHRDVYDLEREDRERALLVGEPTGVRIATDAIGLVDAHGVVTRKAQRLAAACVALAGAVVVAAAMAGAYRADLQRERERADRESWRADAWRDAWARRLSVRDGADVPSAHLEFVDADGMTVRVPIDTIERLRELRMGSPR